MPQFHSFQKPFESIILKGSGANKSSVAPYTFTLYTQQPPFSSPFFVQKANKENENETLQIYLVFGGFPA